VICTVATDDRAPWKGVMAPLMIGLFIFTAADAIGPASGGSFNPARSLDPVFFNGDFDKVWIYLVGPLVGGVIGGAIWVLFGPTREHQPATIRTTGGVPQSDAASSETARPAGS
jgi:glycerol uptake facilitator-like aquaporin